MKNSYFLLRQVSLLTKLSFLRIRRRAIEYSRSSVYVLKDKLATASKQTPPVREMKNSYFLLLSGVITDKAEFHQD